MGRLSSLPEEIILEILTRLPTKSVLDCKLVCKPWRDLVRHPSLSQMHLKHLTDNDSRKKASLIITGYNSVQRKTEYYYTEYEEGNCDEILVTRKTRMNLSPPFRYCSIVGSCYGLICFTLAYDHNGFGPAYICNPITREYIILPNLQGEYGWSGFGYSPSTNEYKVVRIRCLSHDPNIGTAQVYTVGGGNGGWRSLGEIGGNMKHLRQFAGVLANGALHWVNSRDGTILAFHLADEKFSVFPWPREGVPVPDFSVRLGVLGDFLSARYFDYDNCTSEIWLLKKKNEDDDSDLSWSKQFSFDKDVELSFEFAKSGRLLCYGNARFYSYDPRASSPKDDVGFGMSISGAILHKNTLLSLKALGEKDTKTTEWSPNKHQYEVRHL